MADYVIDVHIRGRNLLVHPSVLQCVESDVGLLFLSVSGPTEDHAGQSALHVQCEVSLVTS